MEIKAILKKPYTDKQRCDFIIEQNYKNGYEIKETSTQLQAWGYTSQEKTEQLAAEEHEAQKTERTASVERIVVNVDGMDFDGDETSQGRMARTLAAHSAEATVQWVLADNTVADVTMSQLAQALRLANDEQIKLWVKIYAH